MRAPHRPRTPNDPHRSWPSRALATTALLTTLAASVLAGQVGTAGDAQAKALPGRPGRTAATAAGPQRLHAHPAATTTGTQARVRAYWTPERMRAARPVGTVRPTAVRQAPSSDGLLRAPAQPRFGKVFFTAGGINYVCSGTVTTSANRDVVTTAGHCVSDGDGTYVSNLVFVPAYDSGARPYGTWVARALLTTDAWRMRRDFGHDVAFAVMAEQNGRSLAEVTGSYALAFDAPYVRPVAVYGYPAVAPFTGGTLWRCFGWAGRDTFGRSDDRGVRCSMTQGSSGGGWISGGRLVSVTSFRYPNERTPMLYGPYLGSTERDLFARASTS